MSRASLCVVLLLVAGCTAGTSDTTTATTRPPSTTSPAAGPTTVAPTTTTTTIAPLTQLVFDLSGGDGGITIDSGGDVDYEIVEDGAAIRSGNGGVVAAEDGNTVDDFYLQFQVDDAVIYAANPTTRLKIEVEYLDEGTDLFSIQYDALRGGVDGEGRFKDSGAVVKADTGAYQTAVFNLCDAYFANRDNGADFRIADGVDGAEVIRRVAVTLTPSVTPRRQIPVDSCGADPFDDQPDSAAIQTCIDQACPGDTVLFTSGTDSPGYVGYNIDQTVFLAGAGAQHDLAFASSDPDNRALLRATPDLLGFVVRLFARSRIADAGYIDDITIRDINIDGNQAERTCFGSDNVGNGVDDNWGSWLPECANVDDPWCSPGGLAMEGAIDHEDPEQTFWNTRERWSTGLKVLGVGITNGECGTMLALGGAAGQIDAVTIDTAGDHVHAPGCEQVDSDEAPGAWSDGITMYGPGHRVTNTVVRDASDIGIVTFGGRGTLIENNTIIASPGSHGMFAGIAVHPYSYGYVRNTRVIGNTVINEADETCGGIHAGIDIGAHMWNAGCTAGVGSTVVGTVGPCSSLSPPPGWSLCDPSQECRVWGYVPEDRTLTLVDNTVTGAQVNYLVEGLDVRGELIVSGNVSETPRMTDWEFDESCTWDGITESWETIDFVAHDPTIDGWEDRRIYCER